MKYGRKILCLAFCALLVLSLPCRAYAAGYKEITAEIAFTFRNDSSVPHTCTARMEPVDGVPAPAELYATAASGGQGQFEVSLSRPGQYRYRICQSGSDIPGVVYDDRVYTVTVVARNASPGRLELSMWATLDGNEKVAAIEFVNRDEPKEEPKTPWRKSGDQPKTGDERAVELYLALMAASALLLTLAALARKRGRKEGEAL